MSELAPEGLREREAKRSEPRSANANGPIAEPLNRRPAVQTILQLQRLLDERAERSSPAAQSGAVVQRATPQELRAGAQEFNSIIHGIETLQKARHMEPQDMGPQAEGSSTAAVAGEEFYDDQMESWLAELRDFADQIAGDRDHEIFMGAYNRVYQYVDKLFDRLKGNANLDRWGAQYLSPILETMQAATSTIPWDRVEKYRETKPGQYAASLREIDPDGSALKMVIAQAAYMSGDMFGVAAALRLDPTLGVVIFYDHLKNKSREIEQRLLDFYSTKDEQDHPRVALIPVTDSQLAYKKATAGDFSDERLFPFGRPSILSNVESASTIGNATRIVAHAYRRNPKLAREELEEEWLPQGAKEGTARGPRSDKNIAQWVAEKGFRNDRSYAFVWFRRSGAKGGAHQELDTSEAATAQIIKATKGTAADQIVLIGDKGYAGGVAPDIDLTEFWSEEDSPFHGSGRKMQLALFSYLKHAGFNIMNIGMRSGALEGPALMGIKTVFLEEKYNLQEGRMDQWQGAVPGFSRVELEHVPTKAGKAELARLVAATIQANGADYWTAIDQMTNLLGKALGGTPPDLDKIVGDRAGAGIIVKKGVFDPQPFDDVFETILKDITSALGKKPLTVLGGQWPAFRQELRAAIHAFQQWSKGRVKEQLNLHYQGPDEGLSHADENKLWEAIGLNVGGWEKVGGSKKGGQTGK